MSGSTPNAVNYAMQRHYGSSNVSTAFNQVGSSMAIDAGGQTRGYTKVDIIDLFNVAPTMLMGRFRNGNNAGGISDLVGVIEGYHSNSTSYDGFKLFSTGNFTGVIKIYGIPN
jgi:hypothetical protein